MPRVAVRQKTSDKLQLEEARSADRARSSDRLGQRRGHQDVAPDQPRPLHKAFRTEDVENRRTRCPSTGSGPFAALRQSTCSCGSSMPAAGHEQAALRPRVEWLPVLGGTPNFLERIRLFSEPFPSGTNQFGQNAGANAARHRSSWRAGFAPFASKIFTLTASASAPSNELMQREVECSRI